LRYHGFRFELDMDQPLGLQPIFAIVAMPRAALDEEIIRPG